MPGFGFFGTVILGGLIGWLASIIGKTSHQMGCLWNIAVGVAGASLGHWIATRYLDVDIAAGLNWKGLAVGVAGALALVLVLRMLGILRKNK